MISRGAEADDIPRPGLSAGVFDGNGKLIGLILGESGKGVLGNEGVGVAWRWLGYSDIPINAIVLHPADSVSYEPEVFSVGTGRDAIVFHPEREGSVLTRGYSGLSHFYSIG